MKEEVISWDKLKELCYGYENEGFHDEMTSLIAHSVLVYLIRFIAKYMGFKDDTF